MSYSWKNSGLKGWVALDGIEPYKNKILLIHRKAKTDNKAIFAIGMILLLFLISCQQAPLQIVPLLDSKRIDLGVIHTIGNNDSVVSLYDFQTATPRRVFDPEETTEYSL